MVCARETFRTRIAQAALHSSDLASGETAETVGRTGEERHVRDIAGVRLLTDILELIARLDKIERSGNEAPQVRAICRAQRSLRSSLAQTAQRWRVALKYLHTSDKPHDAQELIIEARLQCSIGAIPRKW